MIKLSIFVERNDASLPSPEKKIKKVEMDIANDIDSNKADNRKSRNDGSKDKIHYDSKKSKLIVGFSAFNRYYLF